MGHEDSQAMSTQDPKLTPAVRPAESDSSGDPRKMNEPPSKRTKIEGNLEASTQSAPGSLPVASPLEADVSVQGGQSTPPRPAQGDPKAAVAETKSAGASTKTENGGGSVVTNSSGASNSSSHDTLPDSAPAGPQTPASPAPTEPRSNPAAKPPPAASKPPDSQKTEKRTPFKATTVDHLRAKYLGELEYMLLEFRKLERQLLGAKGAAQLEESAGSRERREKLHSFILHLEDTIRQIEMGCKLEAEGKSAIESGGGDAAADSREPGAENEAKKHMAESSALTKLTKEKQEEEHVQKLEEHILANLLPVKIRLKKQLAAQQGASRNPAGMPAPRRGMLQPSAAARGKGTFAAAAEQRQKRAEAARLAAQQQQEKAVRRVSDPTQFGKPLAGGGSSLTQKLHGATLGSKQRSGGHGVGSSVEDPSDGTQTTDERQILYAGMVPMSTQHQSGVAAASGVHELVIENPKLLGKDPDSVEPGNTSAHASSVASPAPQNSRISANSTVPVPLSRPVAVPMPVKVSRKEKDALGSLSLTEDEKRKMRKKRRKRKLRRLARRRERERQRQMALQQAQAVQGSTKGTGRKKQGKNQGKKKGPRAVEYICALCSEAYNSTCDYNPWWALAQHECPKCRKTQVSTNSFPELPVYFCANTHLALRSHE